MSTIKNNPIMRILVKAYSLAILLLLLFFVSGAQSREITIAYNDGVAPLKFDSRAGEPAGILLDIWRLWSQKTGHPIRFIRTETFNASVEMVREGKADLNAGLFTTPARETFLTFSEPVFALNYYIFTHPTVKATATLTDLQGLLVGVVQGGFTRDLVATVAPPHLIREYDSNEALFLAALTGDIKAFVSTDVALLYFLDQNRLANAFGYVRGAPLSIQHYRTAAVRGREDLIAEVNAGLAQITPDEHDILFRRWLVSGVTTIPSELAVLLTPQEREYLARKSLIIVHNESDWAPINFIVDGKPRGFSIDYIHLLAEKTGLAVRFLSGATWDEFQNMLRDGMLDVMMNTAVTPERSTYMAFTPAYLDMARVLYTRRGDAPLTSIEELYGKRFAVPSGFLYQEILAAYPQIEVMAVRDTTEAVLAVSTGRADILAAPMPVFNFISNRLQITNLDVGGHVQELTGDRTVSLHIAVSASEPLLASILTRGMTLIDESEVATLRAKWLRPMQDEPDAARFSLTPEQEAWLAAHSELRLGISTDWPPLEFIGASGEYAGLVSEYIRWLENNLNIRLRPNPDLSWSQVLSAAQNRDIDVVSSIVASEEREAYLIFTRPYLSMPLVIATHEESEYVESLERLAGKTVAVIRGHIIQHYLERDHPDVTLFLVDSTEAAMQAVAGKQAFAVVEIGAVLHFLMNRLKIDSLRIAAPTPYTYDLSFGVRRDMPELAAILDMALAAIPEIDQAVFYERWINMRFPRETDWGRIWRIGLVTGFVVLGILITVFIWNQRLAGEIARRRQVEADLQESLTQIRTIRLELQQIFDNAHVGILFLRHGRRIHRGNARLAQIWGYESPSELVGLETNRIHLSPKSYEQFGREHHSRLATGEQVTTEHQFRRKDGSPVWCSLSGRAVDTVIPPDLDQGVIWVVDDITRRRQIEQAIQDQLMFQAALIDTIPNPIFIKDTDARFAGCNKAYEEAFGTSRDRIKGKTVLDLEYLPRDVRMAYHAEDIRLLREGGVIHHEFPITYSDGQDHDVMYWVATFDLSDGRRGGMIGVIVDISERKHIERELRSNLAELERFNRLVIGREERMIELKQEINALLADQGLAEKYAIAE